MGPPSDAYPVLEHPLVAITVGVLDRHLASDSPGGVAGLAALERALIG